MSVGQAKAAASVTQWFAMHGVSTSRVIVESFHERGAGLGLVACVAIAAGEVILRVPQRCWWPLSAEAARERARRDTPHLLKRIDALDLGRSRSLADATVLAADLATQLSSTIQHSSYLQVLPVHLDMPSMWPTELRRVLLAGASCRALTNPNPDCHSHPVREDVSADVERMHCRAALREPSCALREALRCAGRRRRRHSAHPACVPLGASVAAQQATLSGGSSQLVCTE